MTVTTIENRGAHPHPRRRLRRHRRRRVGAVGRSAQARALVGAADLPGDVRGAQPPPGALVTYFMTSPEGDKHYGWWRIGTVDAPRGLTIEDGFGDADGKPLTDKTGQLRMRLLRARRRHADGAARPVPLHRADGGGAEDGHGGGPASGRRADGRSALVDVAVAGSATGPGSPPGPLALEAIDAGLSAVAWVVVEAPRDLGSASPLAAWSTIRARCTS